MSGHTFSNRQNLNKEEERRKESFFNNCQNLNQEKERCKERGREREREREEGFSEPRGNMILTRSAGFTY